MATKTVSLAITRPIVFTDAIDYGTVRFSHNRHKYNIQIPFSLYLYRSKSVWMDCTVGLFI